MRLGRPAMPEGEARSEVLTLRLTPGELKSLTKWASEEGFSVSALARDRLLSRNGIPQSVIDHCKRLAARAMDAEKSLAALAALALDYFANEQ